LALSVWRSIFATLLHVVATGIIAFFVVKRWNNKSNTKNILWILIWIISGFVLHGLYNLSLYYNTIIFTILILIVCYFILSFLLFKSDLIYQKK
jgi:RsiW-degrading membrane proteinase PrsW (M82 family)